MWTPPPPIQSLAYIGLWVGYWNLQLKMSLILGYPQFLCYIIKKKTEVAQGSKYAQFEIIYSMFWKIFMDQTYLIWTKHIYLTYQTLLFALNSREDYFYNKLRSYGYLKYLYFATRTIYLQNVSWKLMNNFLPYVLTW